MAISSGWQLAAEIGGGLLGTMLGGNLMGNSAASQQDRQFSHNWGLMEHQANLNRQLYNDTTVNSYKHRYQWSVDDLRLAGLNPVLAATQGLAGTLQGTASAGLGSVGMSQVPDYMSSINSAFQGALGRKAAMLQFEKNLELQERSVAVQEMEAQTRRLDVENQISNRAAHLDLEKAAQKFDQDLRSAWQDFAIENQNRLTELKAQETAASIKHMAAQDANLSTMAQVALRDVSVKEVLAKVAEENGISHRALEAAQAVCSDKQAAYYEKYGKTVEAQADLYRAQTALTNYKRSVAGIETMSDVMKGILSVAIGAKIGMDMVGSDHNPIGF